MKESFLNEIHIKLGARFINFFGYKCPVYFKGIIEEVLKVRKNFGIFDLFHMGRIFIYKDNNFPNLEKILSIKLETIKNYVDKGKAKYCLLLNDRGNIIDDIVVYDYHDKLLVVCNAANKEKNIGLFKELELNFSDESENLLMIAIQGPNSKNVVKDVFNKNFDEVYFYEYLIDQGIIFSRTGYTGEDGFEIYATKDIMYDIVKKLVDNYGEVWCGLGARDTLRIEVGLPLYGNEIDENTSPLEAKLEWAVNVNREFKKEKNLRYFCVDDSKKIPRKGEKIFYNNEEVGFISSGTFSPWLNKPIGMLYFYGSMSYAECKTEKLLIKVFDRPLIKPRYYKKVKV